VNDAHRDPRRARVPIVLAGDPMSVTVHCPHCNAACSLPDVLLGPRGARLRCPRCAAQFEVGRPAAPIAAAEHAAAPEAERPEAIDRSASPGGGGGRLAPRLDGPEGRAALQAVDALARACPTPAEAWSRGRLFSEAGEALLRAFEDYRRRAGADAGADIFREALRVRWGCVLRAESHERSAIP
jgi:predicted Zn finger-like uncharacterized protein